MRGFLLCLQAWGALAQLGQFRHLSSVDRTVRTYEGMRRCVGGGRVRPITLHLPNASANSVSCNEIAGA